MEDDEDGMAVGSDEEEEKQPLWNRWDKETASVSCLTIIIIQVQLRLS